MLAPVRGLADSAVDAPEVARLADRKAHLLERGWVLQGRFGSDDTSDSLAQGLGRAVGANVTVPAESVQLTVQQVLAQCADVLLVAVLG